MFVAIVLVLLFILVYKAVEDLHESVVIARNWNPDVKISRTAQIAYNLIERRINH